MIIPPDLAIVAVVYFLLGYFLLSSVMAGNRGGDRFGAGKPPVFGDLLVDSGDPVLPDQLVHHRSERRSRHLSDAFSADFADLDDFADGFQLGPAVAVVASLMLLLLTGLIVAWASARIFRWALLLYGKRPGLRELLRVIRRPAHMATTATGEHSA